jgi:uncharacterized Zn finger protein
LLDFGETLIQENSSPESFRRGREYYRQGAVASLVRRGGELRAEVEGSSFAPYEVHVTFDAAGITGAACSCPYDWGGWCKHIVATLLAAIYELETMQELPTLEDVLSGLDPKQLKNILLKLAERNSYLADVIEREVSLLQTSPSEARHTTVDASSIRYQIHSIIRSLQYMRPSEAYWHVGGLVNEVRRVLDGAWAFIEAQDGRGALVVLEAITDEYMEAWEHLDDSNGEVGEFFYELGAAWSEALLSAELTPREREKWSGKLDEWWEELEMYAGGEAFEAALMAVEQGWDHPPLLRVLEGGVPEQEEEYYDGDLTVARLKVLERQERHEEYLRLADYAKQVSRYAVMLIRLGRVEEAVEYGLTRLRAAEEALAVAESLREHEELESALRIGEHGLSQEGPKATLAVWVRDLASEMGQPDRALEPDVIGFREDPSLASYLRVRELSGERWPEYRSMLLDRLRQSKSYYPVGHVEVFLHEGLVGDAITTVERSPVGALIEQVAAAAVETHPDWVIGTCRQQAEEIMEGGKSQYYSKAIDWLRKAKAAYLAAGRGDEWRMCLTELLTRHQRKYKLRPMLEDLAK